MIATRLRATDKPEFPTNLKFPPARCLEPLITHLARVSVIKYNTDLIKVQTYKPKAQNLNEWWASSRQPNHYHCQWYSLPIVRALCRQLVARERCDPAVCWDSAGACPHCPARFTPIQALSFSGAALYAKHQTLRARRLHRFRLFRAPGSLSPSRRCLIPCLSTASRLRASSCIAVRDAQGFYTFVRGNDSQRRADNVETRDGRSVRVSSL